MSINRYRRRNVLVSLLCILSILTPAILQEEKAAGIHGYNFPPTRNWDRSQYGRKDTTRLYNDCATPGSGGNWWTVDLGSVCAISSVTTTTYGDYHPVLSVSVSDTQDVTGKMNPCKSQRSLLSETTRHVCDPVLYGSYIIIKISPGAYYRPSQEQCQVKVKVTGKKQVGPTGQGAGQGTTQSTFPKDRPTVDSITDSSAVIKWKKITADDREDAGASDSDDYEYQYDIEYHLDVLFEKWSKTQVAHRHDPSLYQAATLTGLTYNTRYEVRTKSYRVQQDAVRDHVGSTESNRFKTKCIAPSVPRNVSVTPQRRENTLKLFVTWKDPLVVGCDGKEYTVSYRLIQNGVWVKQRVRAARNFHSLQLNPADYVVRVTVTTYEGHSSRENHADVKYHLPFPDEENSGMYGAMVASVTVFVIILVVSIGLLLLLIYRHCRKARSKTPALDMMLQQHHANRWNRRESDEDRYATREQIALSAARTNPLLYAFYWLSRREKQRGERSARAAASTSRQQNDRVVPARPIGDTRIKLDNMATYIKNKRIVKDAFGNEYRALKEDLQYPCTEGENPEIQTEKNRYTNIIAYDHNRVILDLVGDDPNSSYINASYISGYKDAEKEYVACQGPMDETVNDMWRMMWQIGSNCIVMLTMPTENGQEKSAQYWPEKDRKWHKYGGLSVQTRQEEVFADYVVRILAVRKERASRTVRHFHFTPWADRSSPELTFPLLHFRRKVMAFNSSRTGPLVIHCSAGVGRTGTYIAIDYLAKQAKNEQFVDVFRCVEKLREQRPNMVQTLSQYVFVHESLLELVEIGNTSIPCDELEAKYRDLCGNAGTYANIFEIRKQFEMIGQRRIFGIKRQMSIIPPNNTFRPLRPPRKDDPDFVNSVFVDSYRKKDMYIVAQRPMQETVTDFWQLMLEYDYHTIIMLENLDDDNQIATSYWPKSVGSQQEVGPLTVELLSEDTSGDPSFVIRDFGVSRTKDTKKSPTTVKQYQLTSWDRDEHLTVALQRDFLRLMDKVAVWQAQSGDRPVFVHCLNGVSRSGLFCAAEVLIDMMKTEQEVDVVYVVRRVRTHRSQLIENVEQYQFLHELSLTYLTQFDTYANYIGPEK